MLKDSWLCILEDKFFVQLLFYCNKIVYSKGVLFHKYYFLGLGAKSSYWFFSKKTSKRYFIDLLLF